MHLEAIEDAVGRISSIARNADLSARVEHLNRWRVRDVVAHLGGVHRWAARIITERSMAGPGFKKSKLTGIELCDWFDEGAAALLAALTVNELGDPCPNFNPGSEATIGWWARRQAHESSVHRWDIEHALGCTTALPAKLAADGIDEFLDVFIRTRGKQTLASPLVLRTTRPKREWTLVPAAKPGRIDVHAGPSGSLGAAPTEVSGPPAGLLLALWGRQSSTDARLTISGNPIAATALLAI